VSILQKILQLNKALDGDSMGFILDFKLCNVSKVMLKFHTRLLCIDASLKAPWPMLVLSTVTNL